MYIHSFFSPTKVAAQNYLFGSSGGNFFIKPSGGSNAFQMDSTGHISTATINASNLSSGTFGSNTGGGAFTFSGNAIINGNIGIGTANPASKLDVVGDINTSGQINAANLGGVNLVNNSSNMASFNASTANVTFIDGRTIQALYSHQDGTNGCYQWGSSQQFRVDPNSDYVFSIWAQANSVQNIYVGFTAFDANHAAITSGNGGTDIVNPYFNNGALQTNGGWKKITGFLRKNGTPLNASSQTVSTKSNKSTADANDWAMPSNTAYALIRFGSCYGGTGTTGVAYFYDPQVREVSGALDENYGAIYSVFNGTNYNVGIGTTVPSAKLHIVGTTEQLRLGYDASNYQSLTTNSSGSLTITRTAQGGCSPPLGCPGVTFSNAAQFNSDLGVSGNVGIGTTGPQAPLDVAGVSSVVSNGSGNINLTPNSNLVLSQGYFGVGTASPGERLEVNGKIKFTLDGSTISKAPRIIHATDPRSGCPPAGAAGTPLWTTTFTLTNTSSVYITGKTIRNFSGRNDMSLYLDGSGVDTTLDYTPSAQWNEEQMRWSGTLAAGSHTVGIGSSNANVQGCGAGWGTIDIIIFEQ
ncbi:hypothetical protein M1271_07125 [Patescibacteria group bacterium]|nr:hypothetical protein [Patescibacteria group bacterium]